MKKSTPSISKTITFTLILSFLFVSVSAQITKQSYQEIVNEHFGRSAPGAAILVTKNAETIYQSAIGKKDLESNSDINPNDVFRIASITKQFTAMAILKLYEVGALDLEDSIDKYVDGLTTVPSPVKLKHLLSHTAGVKNYTAIEDWDSKTSAPNLTTSEIVNIFKNTPLDFEPGESYNYSNLGYYLLGEIIEVASGKSYREYLNETFFIPLKMLNTGYEDQSNPQLLHIQGYSQNDNNYAKAEELDMKLAFAAGGLVSTTEDLNKWNTAVFSGKLLSEANLNLAHTKFQLNDGTVVPYGFGWEIGQIKGRKTVKHDGIINGFISFALYIPEENVFVSVLTNCICTPHIEELSSKLAALAIKDPYVINKVAISKSELLDFQGIYKSEIEGEQIIGFQDGQNYIYNRGGQKYPLTYIGNKEFILESTLERFIFDLKALTFERIDFDSKTSWTKISDEVMALQSRKIEEKDLREYYGKYQVKGAFAFDVYFENGKFYGAIQGDSKEIVAYEKDKFFTKNTDIKLEFVRNAYDEVSKVILRTPMEFQGDRIQD